MRVASAPGPPQYTFDGDGQIIEYLLSFPMHIVDSRLWKPIEYVAGGVPISIQPPMSSSTRYQPEWRLGNEDAEAFCSMVHVRTSPRVELSYRDGWEIVEKLLEWTRIKCRHYWLLHGLTGIGARYRGTITTRQGKELSVTNFASYFPGVVVGPLTAELWLSMRKELESNADIPLADSIYCDALLSVAARDEMKALLEAGVAAEVAITQLLIAVSSARPDSKWKAEFRKNKGDFHSFKDKLTVWPQRLGLEPATGFTCPGMTNIWVQRVQELYQIRNGVAHAGRFKSNIPLAVGHYIFSANALLEYCRAQRFLVGLEDFSMPQGTSPYEQTIVWHEGFVDTDSQTLRCIMDK